MTSLAYAGSLAQGSSLNLTSAVANPGATVTLDLALSVSGTAPAGLEWTTTYSPAQISAVSITLGPAAAAAGKTISCSSSSGTFTCVLSGLNANPDTAGVVAYVNATIAPAGTTASIQVSNSMGTDPNGNGLSLTSAGGMIIVPSLLPIACNPISLSQGAVSSCTVALTQAAPAGGSSVSLASNSTSLSVPASVTVAAGSATATFSASAGSSIASNQSATVTATLGGISQTTGISLLAPALVSGMTCNPASLPQSAVSTCTVTLAQAAPTGGSAVALASNNTSLTVPGFVTVAGGAATTTFSATAAASIASNQSVMVTAALGSSSQTASISLLAPVLVSGVNCNPSVLGPGGLGSCSVSLSQALPAISLVHVTSCGPQTFPTATCIIPATGSGNLIVVGWQAGAGLTTPVTIGGATDNVGNSYGEAGNALSTDVAAGSVADIWYARNSVAGATALTITPSSVITGGSAVIWEFSGADLSAPLDQTAILNSQAATATPSGAAVTTGAGADVVISLAAVAGNVTGIVSGNTFVSDSAIKGNGWTHLITSAPGTYAAQWSQNPAGTYASSTVAFKAAGSVTLTSNNPMLTVPASVTVAPGSTSAAFNASAATSIGISQSATVTATLGSSSQTASISLLAPVLVSGVTCSPTSLSQSAVSTCTVTLTQVAPTGGSAVALVSNSTSLYVPASVNLAAGTTTANFSATAAASIASNQNATVTATLGSSSQTASISLLAPVLVSAVACSPTSLSQSAVSTCTVTLGRVAPTGGSAVTLASNNTSLSVPASVTVFAGVTTASFGATAAVSITSNQSATVTAILGSSSKTASISLLAPALVSRVACNPTSLGQNSSTSCTVTLNTAAGSNGSAVSLKSSNPNLTVPGSVMVPAGATNASFIAQTGVVRIIQISTVTASLNGSVANAAVILTGPRGATKITAMSASQSTPEGAPVPGAASAVPPADPPSSLICSPRAITGGGLVTCELIVSAGPKSDAVALSSSSDQVLIPSAITTRPNQSGLTFEAQTSPVSKQQPVTITATLGTSHIEDTILVIAAATPVLLVPNKQVAKAGVPISFVVRAVDPSDLPLRVEGTRIPPGASFDPQTGVFEWSPEVSQAGRHRITFTATNSARQSATSQVEIEVDSGTPTLNQPLSSCSPAAVVTLTGKWLGVPGSQFSDPTGASLNLGGTTVVVNGQAVPVLYSSADRVDFLCPAREVAAGTQLTVEVTSPFGFSHPVTTSIDEATPRILSPKDSNQDQGLISFETMNDLAMERNFRVPAHPAQPGDEIVIFATGLGSAGGLSSGTILVRLSDVYAAVESVHSVPGYAGVYAIQLRVPTSMTFGTVPVQLQIVTAGGNLLKSNSVMATFEAVRQ